MNWRDVIGERDREVYEAAGYGRRATPGKRPMLLVIDVTYSFTGPARMPVLEAVERYPLACGEPAWDAVDVIAGLLSPARSLGRPVVYSAGFSQLGPRGLGMWRSKSGRSSDVPDGANEIVAQIAPAPDDVLLPKTKPSLFHATPLLELLVQEGADTLVICGCTTSGCVRATVLDAFSHNFPVLVVEDGVFDRGELSHAVNLFDMDQKYANVISSVEAAAYLARVASR